MLQLLPLLLLVQIGTAPDVNLKFRDRASGNATPVTDKDLRPVKAPDCRSEADVQRALEQVGRGEQGDCFIKDIRAFSRR